MGKIFNWKVVSILYTILYAINAILGPINDKLYFFPFESFLIILSLFSVMFVLGVCYAVGWKKRLFSPLSLSVFILVFIITIILSAIQSVFDNIQYIENLTGLFIAIIFSIAWMILLNIPTAIAFFVYVKNVKNYEKIEKPMYKMIISIMAFNFIGSVIQCLINKIVFTNLFDYLSIIGGLIFLVLGIGYAWNIKIGTKQVVRTLAFYFIIISLLPTSLLSYDYLLYNGVTASLANPIGISYIVAQIAFQIFVVYRYAFTKNVFEKR